MAKKNPEIERLRAEVLARHAAANRKVARLRRQGIDLNNTKYDIRREIARVRRYNMHQLNSYLRELVGFNSRSNQFGASAGGPISMREWKAFKDVERRVNEIGRAHDASMADIKIDPRGMTVGEREAMLHPLARFDRESHRPYSASEKKLRNVNGPEALEKLRKNLEKKLNKNRHISNSIRQTKSNFKKMLTDMGASELAKELDRLSLKQADVLFNYSPFAAAVSTGYGDYKDFQRGGKAGYQAGVVEDSKADVLELLDWAKRLPKK